MSWEYSVTMSFIGSALVLAYLGSCIKDDEENIRWTRWIPMGLRTVLWILSFGMLIFAIGVQTPILIENNIHVQESSDANSTLMLQNNIIGGVSILTTVFYVIVVILIILLIITIIERMLLRKRGDDDDYKEY